MDLLMAEISRKRKAVQKVQKSSTSKKRQFFKASDLRRVEEDEQEQQQQQLSQKNKKKKEQKKDEQVHSVVATRDTLTTTTTAIESRKSLEEESNNSSSKSDTSKVQQENSSDTKAEKNLNEINEINENKETASGANTTNEKSCPEETTKMLRSMGLPIRLFGEKTISLGNNRYDDSQRLSRLREAKEISEKAMTGINDMEEFRLGKGHGIRNPFLDNTDNNDDEKRQLLDSNKKSGTNKKEEDDENDTNDPPKRIYKYFKSLLKQWEDDLVKRSESAKRTAQGKIETKTLKQCKDYIRPLFKLCKNRNLEPFLEEQIHKIVLFCEEGEFVKAHDVYNDVAIGRAAWPIGVTMVGIHARSGRAKIESGNVAHVMNSELQRKYLTSVKRLMSYNQKKRTDVAPSKKVMN